MITPPLTVPTPFRFNAKVIGWTDGDTGHFEIDRGVWEYARWDIRLVGCNAIELEDPGGQQALENLYAVLPPGAPVVLDTVKPDKFGGRLDALVFYRPSHHTLVSELASDLVVAGWAAPWNGKGPKPVPAWPRPNFDMASRAARRAYHRSAVADWSSP